MGAVPLSALIQAGAATLAAGTAAFFLSRIALDILADLFGLARREIAAERQDRQTVDRIIRGTGSAFLPVARIFPRPYLDRTELRLVFAGRPHGGIDAPRYLAAMVGFGLVGGLCAAVLWGALHLRVGGVAPAALVVAFLIGFGLTMAAGLSRLATEADLVADEILKEFPFFLDLAILTVQAGGTPGQALDAYVEAMPGTVLAREIEVTARDAEATSIDAALLRMMARVRPEPIRQILRNLAQAEQTTGNVAQFYAEQAFELRAIRAEMAERARNNLKLKLKIPEIMIVTAIAIGVLAPSIVQMGLF